MDGRHVGRVRDDRIYNTYGHLVGRIREDRIYESQSGDWEEFLEDDSKRIQKTVG